MVEFNIIENPCFEFENLLGDFAKLYKDKKVTCDKIKKCLNISENEYKRIRHEVINRGLITGEERIRNVKNPKYYYYSNVEDKWVVKRTINNKKVYFFSCDTEAEAIKLRDALISVGWCKDKVDRDSVLGK